MNDFVRANPHLFHVTHRSAVGSIRAHGLKPTTALAPPPVDAKEVIENREAWTPVPGPDGGTAWLRWQRMPDGPISTRLHPAIPPAAWRLFINGMVFFFPSDEAAQRLRGADPDRDQVVLRFATRDLVEAGCALVTCRWNNGYLDRTAATNRRLRSYDDYRPAASWRRGDPLGEIAAWGGVPVGIEFVVAGDEKSEGTGGAGRSWLHPFRR